MPAISVALYERFDSRLETRFAHQVIAALRIPAAGDQMAQPPEPTRREAQHDQMTVGTQDAIDLAQQRVPEAVPGLIGGEDSSVNRFPQLALQLTIGGFGAGAGRRRRWSRG